MLPADIALNPFYQPPRQWQIRVFALISHIPAIEDAFRDWALATSSFEIDEAREEWAVDIVTGAAPEPAELASRLALLSGLLAIPTPRAEVGLLESRDWAAEAGRNFPPLSVGRFYVYGSHITGGAPQGKIALRISAGAAFGSGEHATTSGCLRALALLARRRKFDTVLDMGCGSGILAIAAVKLWRRPVIGVDIDPVSVSVARENAGINRVRPWVRFNHGDGYDTAAVRCHAPFDLIIANILARPLIRMAPRLACALAPGGIAVLSGLLASQERRVLAAHHAQGLRLRLRIVQGGWSVLILKKSGTKKP